MFFYFVICIDASKRNIFQTQKNRMKCTNEHKDDEIFQVKKHHKKRNSKVLSNS